MNPDSQISRDSSTSSFPSSFLTGSTRFTPPPQTEAKSKPSTLTPTGLQKSQPPAKTDTSPNGNSRPKQNDKDEEQVGYSPSQIASNSRQLSATTTSNGDIAEFRERGNELYRVQDFEGAISEYTKGLEINRNSIPLLVNRALASIKLHRYTSAVRDCTDALVIDRVNVKALVRRAMAWRGKKKPQFALDDLKTAAKYAATNTEIQRMMRSVEQEIATQEAEEDLLKRVMQEENGDSLRIKELIKHTIPQLIALSVSSSLPNTSPPSFPTGASNLVPSPSSTGPSANSIFSIHSSNSYYAGNDHQRTMKFLQHVLWHLADLITDEKLRLYFRAIGGVDAICHPPASSSKQISALDVHPYKAMMVLAIASMDHQCAQELASPTILPNLLNHLTVSRASLVTPSNRTFTAHSGSALLGQLSSYDAFTPTSTASRSPFASIHERYDSEASPSPTSMPYVTSDVIEASARLMASLCSKESFRSQLSQQQQNSLVSALFECVVLNTPEPALQQHWKERQASIKTDNVSGSPQQTPTSAPTSPAILSKSNESRLKRLFRTPVNGQGVPLHSLPAAPFALSALISFASDQNVFAAFANFHNPPNATGPATATSIFTLLSPLLGSKSELLSSFTATLFNQLSRDQVFRMDILTQAGSALLAFISRGLKRLTAYVSYTARAENGSDGTAGSGEGSGVGGGLAKPSVYSAYNPRPTVAPSTVVPPPHFNLSPPLPPLPSSIIHTSMNTKHTSTWEDEMEAIAERNGAEIGWEEGRGICQAMSCISNCALSPSAVDVMLEMNVVSVVMPALVPVPPIVALALPSPHYTPLAPRPPPSIPLPVSTTALSLLARAYSPTSLAESIPLSLIPALLDGLLHASPVRTHAAHLCALLTRHVKDAVRALISTDANAAKDPTAAKRQLHSLRPSNSPSPVGSQVGPYGLPIMTPAPFVRLAMVVREGKDDEAGNAAVALAECGKDKESHSLLLDSGCLEALVQCMQTRQGHTQRNAAIALARASQDPNNLARVRALHGIELMQMVKTEGASDRK
ncbi:hypothetical protein BLNAU_6232 [Blattamonas nauphoetae]|uniref:Uncharacterized protein n=1 Tax=Blattamonas nauphoetae TaxID=2049346 RepID=A0ABQ9Y4U0_9EUKA|nr:hypothetical protein BLNAU_6232 [Blattamonas nauphoetae]